MIMPPDCKIPSKEVTGKHVIDAGALLHRVPTQHTTVTTSNEDTALQLLSSMGMKKAYCLQSQMRICQDRATKVHHVMWSSNGKTNHLMLIPVFYHNKCQLIALLKDRFLSDGHQVYVCKSNVDTTIVSKSLEESKRCQVVVAADDTDVAVMLCYHLSKKQLKEVLFYQERKMQNAGAYRKPCQNWEIWKIIYFSFMRGQDVTQHLLSWTRENQASSSWCRNRQC